MLDVHGPTGRGEPPFPDLFALSDEVAEDEGFPRIAEADDRARTAAAVAGLVAGSRDDVDLEQCYLRPDGSRLCGRLTASRLVVGRRNGRRRRWSPSRTSRTSRSAGLRSDQAHRRLEAMLANISDTVTMVDADGVVIDTTGLHTSIMGYETDYWKQRSVIDLVDPRRPAPAARGLRAGHGVAGRAGHARPAGAAGRRASGPTSSSPR